MRRSLVAGIGIALLSGSITGTGNALDNSSPEPVFVAPSAQLEDAGRAAMELVDAKPADYTGARITGRDNTVTIALPGGAGFAQREAAARRHLAARGVSASVVISFVVARQSQAALEAQKQRILAGVADEDPVSGVGEDGVAGVPIVYLTEASQPAEDRIRATAGSAVRFEVMARMELTAGHRRLNEAPHWGGAGYRRWTSDHSEDFYGWCSTGFPVVVRGYDRMLTAGHCMPGATSTPAAWAENTNGTDQLYNFGSLWTTTIGGTIDELRDGSQDDFGDWALLSGARYEPVVYTGGVQSTVGLYIGAADYNTPAEGSQVCSSGRTTGSVCRLFVHDGDTIFIPDGQPIRSRVATVRSNQALGTGFDCEGMRTGDSGGAIYQGLRPGWARVLGVVTGGTRNPSGQCFYHYSKLSGLKAWDASTFVPLHSGSPQH